MKAAIYSRKSKFTGKGESIENQIELCKDYGKNLGVTEYCIYEDEGFSGGNTDRPQFQQMMKDAKDKKFDILICYRLDRVSRNIADFASLIEELQVYSISFVSIREQFDTSTPMGRAMMYIASVFAQLERETIAERIRDNLLELAKTGRWLGGQVPFGFESKKVHYFDSEMKERSLMQLSPINAELNIVSLIYEKYLELGSLSKVHKYLYSNNIKTKLGGEWNKNKVLLILRSPLYVKSNQQILDYLEGLGMTVAGKPDGNGILTYNKTKGTRVKRDVSEWIAAVSRHKGIIPGDKWIEIQNKLDKNKEKAPRMSTSSAAMLTGILKCSSCGSSMIVRHGHKSRKTGEVYKYYACSCKEQSGGKRCSNKNVRVDELEDSVLRRLKRLKKEDIIKEIESYKEEISASVLEGTQSKTDEIEEQISEKEDAIKNLVTQLSQNKNSSITKYIIEEMEKLNKEVEDLKAQLTETKNEQRKITNQIINIDLILSSLDQFNKTIDCFEDIDYKKSIISKIVDSIYWDGQTGNIDIRLWGAKKK